MHFSHLRIYLLYVLLNICSFRDPEGVIAKIKTTAMTENVSNNSTTKYSFNGSKDEKFRLSVSKVKLSSASIDKMNLHLDNFVLQQKGAHFNKSNFLLRKKRYLQDTLDKSLSHLLNVSRLKTYPQYIDDDSSLAYKKRKSYFNKDSTFQDLLGLGNNYFKTIPNNSPHIIQTLPQNKKQTGESSHKAKRHLINWKKKIHDSNRSKRWFDNKILKLEGDLQRSLWHLINGSHVGKRAPRDNFLEELYANLNSQSRIMKNGYGAPSHMLVLKSKVPTPPRLSSFKRKSTVPSLTLYPPGYPKSIIIPPSSPPKIVPPPPVAAVPRLQFTNPWQDRVTKNISRSVLSLKVTEHNILSAEKILLTALFNLKKTLTRTLERTSYWNQRWMLHKLEQTVYNATRFAAWSMVQKTCERSLRLAQEAGYIYWSEWTTWSGCSGDCNSPGFRVRHRTCKSGRICIGPSFDIVVCAMKIKCQAKWLEWAPWNRCSATCGSGIQTRSRICLTEDEDTPCNGDSVVSRSCPGIPCKQVTPVKGLKKVFAASLGRPVSKGQEHWSSWGLWSSCSVSCGEGNQTRARACVRRTTNDLIKLPVDDIFCPGTARQRKWCNLPCNVLKVITCDDNPCKNDALCEEVMDSKSGLGFHFRCLCKSGFHGRNCETAVISPSHMMWIKTLAYFLLGLIIALIVICIAMFVYFRIQSNKKTSMTFTPIPRHRSEDLWQMHENEGKSSSNLSGLTESDSGSSGRTSSKKGFKNVSADESFNSLQNSKITIRSTHFTEPDDPAMVLSSDDDYQSCEESSSVEKDLKNYSKNDTGNASPRVGNTSRHKQPRGNKISQIRVTQPPEPSVSSDLVYNDEVMEMRIHSNLNRLEEVQDRINYSPDSSENGEYQLCAIVTRSERNDDNFSHYQESGDSSGEVDFTNSDYRTVNGNRSTQRKINKENEIETFSRHRGKPSDETQSNNKKPSIETQSNRNKSSDKTQSRSSKLSNETQSNSNKPSNETHSNSNKPSTSGREQRTFSCDGQESKSGHNNPGSSWNSNTSVNPLGVHLDWSFEDRASASTSRDENKTGSDCRASASTSRDENKTGSDCRREYSPQGAHICASSNSHFLSYSDQTNEAGCANRTRHEKCVAFNEVGSTSRDRHENFVVFNEGGNLIKARCENGVAFNEGASANRIRHSIGIAFNEGGKVNRARYESGVALQESSISFNSCHASTNQHYDSYPPIVDQMDERLLHNARGQNGDFIPTAASNQQQYLDGGGEGSTTSARRDQRKSDREVLLRRAIENSFVQSTSGTSLCNIQRSEQQILPKTPAVNQTQSPPSNRINDYSIDEDTRPLDVNWLENQDPQTLSVLHVISTPKKAKSRSQTLDRRKTPSSSFDRGTPSTSSDSKSSSTNSESSDSDSSESQTQKTRLSHSRSEDDSSRHISNPYMSSAHTSSPKIQEHGSSSFQREFVNSDRSDRNLCDKDRGFDRPMKENDLKAKHRLMPNTSSGSQARASHSLSLRDNQEPSLTAKLNLDKSSYWDSYNQSSIFGQSTSASSSSREEHTPCHEHLISQNQMFQAMQPTNILLSDSNYSSEETTQISHHPSVPLKSALRSSHSKGQSKNHIQSVVRRRVSFSEPEVSGVQYKTESAHGSFRQQDLKSGKSTNELSYLPGRPSSPEDQFEEFSQSQGSSTNIFFRESSQKHSSPFSYEGAHSLDSIHVHFQSQEEKQSADFDQKKRSSSDLEVCSIESCFLQSEENQSCRDRVMQAQIHEFALQESSANDGVPSPTFYPVTKTCETLPTGKKNSTQPGEQSSSAPASTEPLNSPVIKSKASDNRTLYNQPPTLVHRKESGSSDRLSRAVEDAAALKMIYDKDGVLADMKESENPSQAPSPAFEQSTPDEPCTSLHHAALSFDSFQHLLIQRKPGAFFKPINKLKPSGSSTS